MKCAECGHSEDDHCKGGQMHSDYKKPVVCVGRHCEKPLCSCVAFVEPKRRKK